MNEREIAHGIVALLDEGTEKLDVRLARRLQAARQTALAHHLAPQPVFSLAGAGVAVGNVINEFKSVSSTWIALAVLMLSVGATQYWAQTQRAAELEEVDSALLSDDLPIAAYLDRDFNEWLKDDSSLR